LLRKDSAAASTQSRFSVPYTKVTVTWAPEDAPELPPPAAVPGRVSAPRRWASQTTPATATTKRTTISNLPRMGSSRRRADRLERRHPQRLLEGGGPAVPRVQPAVPSPRAPAAATRL